MRCRQGDEAVLIAGKQSGTIVTCIELVRTDIRLPTKVDLWRIDVPLRWRREDTSGRTMVIEAALASDKDLLPINKDSKGVGEDFKVALTTKQKEVMNG